MASSPSYAMRALWAFALMIGFYALAVAIAGGLLYMVYLDVAMGGRIHLKLVLFGTIGALTIIWAVVPRRDRFEPPGPRLEQAKQPRLFEELEGVARAAEQVMPTEVYLVPDVNAWVSQRGGVLGFGGRRVMGLGLPLLQALTRDQMRAVLFHEFGHYHGGDTRLGPVLYRTRSAIGRAIEGLGDSSLQAPFRWYGNMFLRVTHATSRVQEFAADALSAHLAGSRAMTEALKALPGLSQAFAAYWQTEVLPVLNANFRVPIAEGFARFLSNPAIADQVREVEKVALVESAKDPYDTHPPLPERIAALEGLPPGAETSDQTKAIALLEEVGNLERAMLEHIYGREPVSKLGLIDWEESGLKVFLPGYVQFVQSQRTALIGVTPAQFPDLAANPSSIGDKLVPPDGEQLSGEERGSYAMQLLGVALAVALHERGWVIEAGPGAPVVLRREGQTIEPFNVLGQLKDGGLSADEWRALTASSGLVELDLGRVAQA